MISKSVRYFLQLSFNNLSVESMASESTLGDYKNDPDITGDLSLVETRNESVDYNIFTQCTQTSDLSESQTLSGMG